MTRIRQTLSLWWRLWREGPPRPARKRPDGTESIDLRVLREVADRNPIKRVVNRMIFLAWKQGVAEWSISPEGISLDVQKFCDQDRRNLADALAQRAPGTSPRPTEINPTAIRAWLTSLEGLSLEERAGCDPEVVRLCMTYADTADLLAEVSACGGRLWPRMQNRLWQMTRGADGRSRWRLPPLEATCQGRISLLMSGVSLTAHVTYCPARIDFRLVPDSPSPAHA